MADAMPPAEQKLAWNPFKTPSKGLASLLPFWSKADTTKEDHAAEAALLSHGRLSVATNGQPPSPAAGLVSKITDVEIDSSGNYIHTLSIEHADKPSRHNLVITHGYFTGLGFFFRNYDELSKVDGWNVYSIDWLGMGRSSRPTYTSVRTSEDERVAAAESFFVESLEEWRSRMGLEKMTLCGHSFGGYMSALYALKYPERVEKLVLVSPIGIPEPPEGYDEILRNGGGPLRKPPTPTPSQSPEPPQSVQAADEAKPGIRRVLFVRMAMNLWERNFAPQWVVRSAGPFGRRLIDWYIGRFSWLSEEQRISLAAYAHQISVLPGSSESALGDILRPGAFARRPLVGRIAGLRMPTVFMYGKNDWVDYTGGAQVIERIGGRVHTHLYRIPKAGHNLHLENPDDFNRALVHEMKALG
ncbi:hypothetical protein IW150_005907 [Coemansia sp. RSA 2607]|nr:hypothetical protein IW150_005907 [Coemansia sp. RSA 2607]